MANRNRIAILFLLSLLPLPGGAVELAELMAKVATTGASATEEMTGATQEKIVQITKARGTIRATVDVIAPLPTTAETCRLMRVRFKLEQVEAKDGSLVPYTQTLTMPWCPSQAGYDALGNVPSMIRVGP